MWAAKLAGEKRNLQQKNETARKNTKQKGSGQ